VRHGYADGSWLSQVGAVKVRVVQYQITIVTSAGRHTDAIEAGGSWC
jgi:hypothetical protein